MKFLDLFAGIGGFRMALERQGHECVGFCEIDKFARSSYKAIYNTEGEIEFHDITRVRNDEWRQFRGRVDIICGGFPCQAFSIAGKRRGFLDETRGTLFFEIARAAQEIKPSLLFLENVKGLLSHDKGRTFRTFLSTLDELGYDAEWQILNSKDFGVPQNRERVFIVGHLRGTGARPIFPFNGESRAAYSLQPKRLGNVNPSGKGMKIAVSTMQGGGQEPKIIQKARGYNKGGEHAISPTLSSHSWQENNHIKVYDVYNKKIKDEVGTLTANGHQGNTKAGTFGILDGYRIRKLTPRECWRLQGFPDWAFDKAQAVNSNSQLYKQAGNSVTVSVIEAIAKQFE
ncbi:TPA: DNA cytosine methyltransferase [Streptococcus agalactiae]|nr:DNA cytosine methyltransferase [Streptococcus agalactiae]